MGSPEHLSQQSFLERIDYRKISRGATFPIVYLGNLITEVGGNILNAGCGPGEKVLSQALCIQYVNGIIIGVDINPHAVANARMGAIESLIGNALFIEGDVSEDSFMGRWNGGVFDIVVAEGLFCNLVGDDPCETVENFNNVLKPGGMVCIADCLRMDDTAFEILMRERFDYAPLDVVEEMVSGYEKQWSWRYQQNEILGALIDDSHLENGVFVVLPPGVNKSDMELLPKIQGYEELTDDFEIKKMEYLDAYGLASLVSAGFVERLARHWRASDLINMFIEKGFEQSLWEETLWYTRTNEPLLGVIAVFKKA